MEKERDESGASLKGCRWHVEVFVTLVSSKDLGVQGGQLLIRLAC